MDCRVGPAVLHFVIEVPAGGSRFSVVDEGGSVFVYDPHGVLVDAATGLASSTGEPRKISVTSARHLAFKILAADDIIR
jgi:hypothetical protein